MLKLNPIDMKDPRIYESMSQTELSIHRGSQAQQAVEMLQMEAGSAREAAASACNNCRSFLFTGASWNLCLHSHPSARLCIILNQHRDANQLHTSYGLNVHVPQSLSFVTQFLMSNSTHKSQCTVMSRFGDVVKLYRTMVSRISVLVSS